MAGDVLADRRTGKNGHHALVGLLRQSVFGRLAGYEDVNDAERLRHDPAIQSGGSMDGACSLQHRELMAQDNKFQQEVKAPAEPRPRCRRPSNDPSRHEL
jgi:hypothetical protein